MTDTKIMEETKSLKKRYVWVDNIKFACCILVVIGHFYMSMIVAQILPSNTIYNLFIQSVYTFHVPLFFVCSGFLYQKSDRVHSVKSWGNNVLDKLLNLGVPYFTFSLITLVIKKIFEDSVNNPVGSIPKTLFISPIAPYWYLYALFFMFVFIPNLKTKKQAAGLFAFAFAARIVYLVCVNNSIALPSVIYSTFCRMIWFVIGMCLALDIVDLKATYSKIVMAVTGVTAIVLSIYFYRVQNLDQNLQYVIGLLFVISIVILSNNVQLKFVNKISVKFRDYFMPVYVMHTITSAGIRILLLKVGITSPAVHIICGIASGILLPMAAYEIAKRIPPLLFFIYPKRAVQIIKNKRINKNNE